MQEIQLRHININASNHRIFHLLTNAMTDKPALTENHAITPCSFRLDGFQLSNFGCRMAEFDFCLELDFIFNYTNFYQHSALGSSKFFKCCDWAEVKWRT